MTFSERGVFALLCNILAFDLAVNRETGACGRRYQGITLTVDGLNWVQVWRRWTSNNNITLCDSSSQSSWRLDGVEGTSTRQRDIGPQDPRLSNPAERERSAAKDRGIWGSICCSLCSVSNSPLTLNPFVTLSQPFRIKYERYIFQKKCVRSSLLCWLCFRMHLYMLHLDSNCQFLVIFLTKIYVIYFAQQGSHCNIVANVLSCDNLVNEFEPQMCYHIHFWINTPRNTLVWTPSSPPHKRSLFLYKNIFGIILPTKINVSLNKVTNSKCNQIKPKCPQV